MTRVLVVDNYDSFAYNLVQYLGELGAEVDVVRNDRATVDELLERRPDRVVVSPGPCTPNEAGVSVEVMRRFPEAGVAALGVCLGHQSLAQAFGGRVVRHEPVHGKSTTIEHDGRTVFAGLESPLTVGRYHSLVVDPQLPECLEQSAFGGDVVMGIRHRELAAEGVQFHPESVLTPNGKALLANFLGGGDGDPLTLARRFVELWNRNDFETIAAALFADDIVLQPDPDWPEQGPFVGRAAAKGFYDGFTDAYGGGRVGEVQVLGMEAVGNRALTHVQWRRAGQSSGAELEMEVFSVLDFREGRMVGLCHFMAREPALELFRGGGDA